MPITLKINQAVIIPQTFGVQVGLYFRIVGCFCCQANVVQFGMVQVQVGTQNLVPTTLQGLEFRVKAPNFTL